MKKINVTSSSLPEYEFYSSKISKLWETRWLTNNGLFHKELEEKLVNKLNVENLTLFSNGHLALEYAIEALNLENNKEVITTPFTFISTTNSIIRKGLTPVFCDIKEEDYNIDVTKIENLITDKTVAIMPVHVYGNPCNVNEIEELAKKHHLKVIYDAAHAFGVEVDGKGIGSFGDISMFSFHATKVFHTVEGGALTYNSKSLKDKLESLKNFGITDPEEAEYIGGNGKLDEFRAAMGLSNLEIIDKEIEKRKKVVERYEKLLDNIKGIKFIKSSPNIKRNYAYMPILFDGFKKNRDEVYEQLKLEDIFARKYFYPLISDFSCYKDKYNSNDTPVAKRIAKNILTLPLYADLSLDDVNRICEIILR
jgi:dTDP-4-amino-4,6-dideoxygalactose transaminase